MYICICMYYYDINVYVHSSNSIQCFFLQKINKNSWGK